MKRIPGYQTDDGRVFAILEDAADHQLRLDLEATMKRDTFHDDQDPRTERLPNNREALIEAFSRYQAEFTPDPRHE